LEEERKDTAGVEVMTASTILAHAVRDLAEVGVVRALKELQSFNRQPKRPFWPVQQKLSAYAMNPEDGVETRANVFSLRRLERVASMQQQIVIPSTRASVTFSRPW
jgi:hypothetical protein